MNIDSSNFLQNILSGLADDTTKIQNNDNRIQEKVYYWADKCDISEYQSN
jgi:hypothetical protein